MAVMIKGMEMPNECLECPFQMYYFNTGETRCRATNTVLASGYRVISFEGRHEDCPIAELPEKKKGYWKLYAPWLFQCSECGWYLSAWNGNGDYRYCPHCGNEMEEDVRIGAWDYEDGKEDGNETD